jgi:HPt (histidine-containing phosphotransfer) domain-containing protein
MDVKRMAENLDIEESELLEIVDLFIETSTSDLNRLQQALEMEDAHEVAKTAHSIKGAAANLAFEEIFEISKNMERKARDKDLDGAMEMVRMIREKLDRIAQDFHDSNPR